MFESGLPVVERQNHSFYISHYPKGRDATVSWGGPDFKFKNDTDHWILIATGYSTSSVTISLYGTDPGYDVTSDVGSWTNVKPHPVKEIEDTTLPEGSRVTEDAGVDGRVDQRDADREEERCMWCERTTSAPTTSPRWRSCAWGPSRSTRRRQRLSLPSGRVLLTERG